MPSYHIRPGTWSDIPAVVTLYLDSFDGEAMLDKMFPGRREDPGPFREWVSRRFRMRYWAEGYWLTVVEETEGEEEDENQKEEDENQDEEKTTLIKPTTKHTQPPQTVAFTWWHRPSSPSPPSLTTLPSLLLRRLISSLLTLHNTLLPIPSLSPHDVSIFDRAFATLEPQLLSTPRRRSAWYLATLSVSPALQRRGLGAKLLRHGLDAADRAGVATWLVGLHALERYYARFGFVEVARANVGELKDWTGGAVMFRNE